MKNTGLFFFIMRTTRLIVAMFVLFAICKPAVATIGLKGAHNMAPNCEKQIKALCNNASLGTPLEVDVAPRDCKVTCTYQAPGEKWVQRGDLLVQNREFEKVNLPEGMPCAFGAKCDKHGKCICEFCNERSKK
uniref:Putative secreted salivary protein n=1 Tax=Ixodes ricinus TaxID=34613 RepID=B0AZW2_IXORI|nr:putative secreted salivary protein precursor [Ixodes ricinus]